jgi:uncharacterized repeat protein (TIGR03803 family)
MIFMPLKLAAFFGFLQCISADAQNLTVLHSFTNNADSQAPLLLLGNTLYGTTKYGGEFGNGAVFAVNTDGTDFTNLYSFSSPTSGTNSDGANPVAGLVLSGNTLYGTASEGGSTVNYGTVFAVNTDGSGFTVLHTFTSLDYGFNYGANPEARLLLSGSTLYGTASAGGYYGNGTVFSVNTDASNFNVLHTFDDTGDESFFPVGGLIFFGDTLYGTTQGGGPGWGSVFAININSYIYTNLCTFTNSNGYPQAGLTLVGNTLYGTSHGFGGVYMGAVFSVNTDGSGFNILHTFTGGTNDGFAPSSDLVLSGDTLYGTASQGGIYGGGTVFAINTDGTGYTSFYSFNNLGYGTNASGQFPMSGLILSSNILYGTTEAGGDGYSGTVFSLTLPQPQLTISVVGTNAILTWPSNAITSSFTLESATNLVPPVAWSVVFQGPAVLNGLYIVTNIVSAAEQFFRLARQ